MEAIEIIEHRYILYFAGSIMFIVLLVVVVVGYSHIKWIDGHEEADHTLENKQLHFAAATITGLGLIFVLSMAMNLWGGIKGEAVFEVCKTTVPPIITLILGYYFGKEKPAGKKRK